MENNLDLQGKTAAAHIEKYKMYGDKAKQHATSAAIILQDTKDKLNRVQYGKWLKKYDIATRTASRLLVEYHFPDKAVERQEKGKERERKVRAAAKSATCGRETPAKSLEMPETTVEPIIPLEEDKRAQLIRAIRDATDDQIDRLFDRFQEGYLYV